MPRATRSLYDRSQTQTARMAMPNHQEVTRAIVRCLRRHGAKVSTCHVAWDLDAALPVRMTFAEFDQVQHDIQAELQAARDQWISGRRLFLVHDASLRTSTETGALL
jgi:hypothetical protein